MKRSDLIAEISERGVVPHSWAVEAIDEGSDGAVYVVIFSGPDARARAEEYAMAKYADYRVKR